LIALLNLLPSTTEGEGLVVIVLNREEVSTLCPTRYYKQELSTGIVLCFCFNWKK